MIGVINYRNELLEWKNNFEINKSDGQLIISFTKTLNTKFIEY